MDEKGSWKRFQRLRVDGKKLSRQARRAETATTRHAHKFVLSRLARLRDIRQHIAWWLIIMAVLIGAIVVQTIWYQQSYRTHASVSGGTYAEGMLGPVDTLNPLYAQSSAELSASQLIFSRLFDHDKTGHLRGDLATNLKADKTGRIYTVTLRQDAAWQDGTRLTAADIEFTVNTMKDPNVRAVMQSTWNDIDVRVVDPQTVEFRLPAPNSPFPYALTFAVLPKHVLGSVPPGSLRENTFSIAPVGSGPFALRLMQTTNTTSNNKIVHLTARDDYYRGAPKLARMELHAYSSSADIMRALRMRDINGALDINGRSAEMPPGLEVKDYPVNSGVYALMNTESQVLKDKTVRKALQVGTDTAAVRNSLAQKAPPLDLPFLPHQTPSTPMPKKPAYNKQLAIKALEKAGWKLNSEGVRVKRKQPLSLQVVAIKDDQYKRVTENLRAQWSQLGAKVEVVEFDPDIAQQSFTQVKLQPRDYDVLVNELAIGADPDVFAYWYSAEANPLGRNYANYRSDLADDILLSARQRSELELRDQKYKAFARQWLKDAPAIGLYQSVMTYAHSRQTTALEDNSILPSTTDRYENVQYWTAEKADIYKTP